MDYLGELIAKAGQTQEGFGALIMLMASGAMIALVDRAPPIIRSFAYVVIVLSFSWFSWLVWKAHTGTP
jgi:hypothetical protein